MLHYYGDISATLPYQPCLFILSGGQYVWRFSRRGFENYHEALAWGYRWVDRWERMFGN